MSTNRNLLTSPKGSLQFLAAVNPVKAAKSDDKLVYTIRLAFDSEKDKEFLEQVAEINDAKVVTAATYRGKSKETKELLATGVSLVSASSLYKPIVYDTEGNEMEDNPYFFVDSTGTAQMIVEPYTSNKGGTINLIGIIIHSLEHAEGKGEGMDRETRLAQLRAAVAAATQG